MSKEEGGAEREVSLTRKQRRYRPSLYSLYLVPGVSRGRGFFFLECFGGAQAASVYNFCPPPGPYNLWVHQWPRGQEDAQGQSKSL